MPQNARASHATRRVLACPHITCTCHDALLLPRLAVAVALLSPVPLLPLLTSSSHDRGAPPRGDDPTAASGRLESLSFPFSAILRPTNHGHGRRPRASGQFCSDRTFPPILAVVLDTGSRGVIATCRLSCHALRSSRAAATAHGVPSCGRSRRRCCCPSSLQRQACVPNARGSAPVTPGLSLLSRVYKRAIMSPVAKLA